MRRWSDKKIRGSEPKRVGFVCVAVISNRPREYEFRLLKHPLRDVQENVSILWTLAMNIFLKINRIS
jgi:hypothetical protein